jgi:hypothetical protein
VFHFGGVPVGKGVKLRLFAQLRDLRSAQAKLSLSHVRVELNGKPSHSSG